MLAAYPFKPSLFLERLNEGRSMLTLVALLLSLLLLIHVYCYVDAALFSNGINTKIWLIDLWPDLLEIKHDRINIVRLIA